MKKIIEIIIGLRNPKFAFDPAMDDRILLAFFWDTIIRIIRGGKALLYFKNPKWAMFGTGVNFKYAHKINWGKFLKLGKQVQLSGLGNIGIVLGNNVSIGSYSQVIVSTSLNYLGRYIKLEDNVGIGEYAYLGGAGGLHIGEGCIIGQYFSCHPENHIYSDIQEEIRHQGVIRKGIKIGKDCWIGSKVTVLDGVNIGSHSVVAAGSVVTRSFPPYSVIGGVPARVLKNRIEDDIKNIKKIG